MTAPASRRGFLRGLTTLPLIGGGVALIGAPSAVAEPVTRSMLETYSEWLRIERNLVCNELYPIMDPAIRRLAASPVRYDDPLHRFFIPEAPLSWRDMPPASTRAALVLSAVGCGWREDGR